MVDIVATLSGDAGAGVGGGGGVRWVGEEEAARREDPNFFTCRTWIVALLLTGQFWTAVWTAVMDGCSEQIDQVERSVFCARREW